MQIHIYAQQGNIAGVAQEIASGVDIDSVDEDSKQTPLMCAVSSTDAGVDMIQFLLEHGANVNAVKEKSQDTTVLTLAVQSGNLNKIQLILDAGADINYKGSNGSDILFDATIPDYYNSLPSQNLISILNLLISRGAAVNTITSRGLSAIKLASYCGRFDAVKLLLDAGATKEQLMWTPLMEAIAFGSLDEVKSLLEQGAEQNIRDCWGRSPWLLSVQGGDVAIAKLLLATEPDDHNVEDGGKTPLMYAIKNKKPEMLRWLIAEGFDVEATDKYGDTALILATKYSATECVKILLEAGANPTRTNKYDEKAIERANNLEIVRMLVAAGGDLSDINDDMRRALTGVANNGFSLSQISPVQYFSGKHPRFGTTNPELMDIPFWQAMICEGCSAYSAKNIFNDPKIWRTVAWCYQRFGRTVTELPDGRIIEIAGEHEDYYDPDFCIYNDVVVYQGDGSFQIFGYPEDVFPPTDFHSATLVGEYIYIIGNLGYPKTRIYNETPVYRLHCHTFKIEKLNTTGEKPGWIYTHKAYYQEPGTICITGGKLCLIDLIDDEPDDIYNLVNYALDLTTLTWSRDTVLD